MQVRGAIAALAAIMACVAAPALADGPMGPLGPLGPAGSSSGYQRRQAAPLPPGSLVRPPEVVRTVNLSDSALRLDLAKGYAFVPAPEVPPLLTKLKADTPRAQILGAVAPAGKKPGASDYWVSVLTYDAIGNVPESGREEMTSMSYIITVQTVRPNVRAFAVTPDYDPLGKTLVWAEQYEAKSRNENSLRHEQRILGRSGVAGVSTVSRPGLLEKVRTEAAIVRNMLSFVEGRRYLDFVPSRDAVSDYDLPGLIDGSRRTTTAANNPVYELPNQVPPKESFKFNWRSLLPGQKYGWVSYVGGALAVLLISSAIFSMFRGRGGGGRRDDDL